MMDVYRVGFIFLRGESHDRMKGKEMGEARQNFDGKNLGT